MKPRRCQEARVKTSVFTPTAFRLVVFRRCMRKGSDAGEGTISNLLQLKLHGIPEPHRDRHSVKLGRRDGDTVERRWRVPKPKTGLLQNIDPLDLTRLIDKELKVDHPLYSLTVGQNGNDLLFRLEDDLRRLYQRRSWTGSILETSISQLVAWP